MVKNLSHFNNGILCSLNQAGRNVAVFASGSDQLSSPLISIPSERRLFNFDFALVSIPTEGLLFNFETGLILQQRAHILRGRPLSNGI